MAKRKTSSKAKTPRKRKKRVYTEEQKLIKRVNQNLVRLERAGFNTYAKRQLEERMKDLNAWTGKGRVRFSVPELDKKEKKAFIKALQFFEASATHTVGGTKKLSPEFEKIFRSGKIVKIVEEVNEETGEIELVEKEEKLTSHEQYMIEALFELEETESFMENFEYDDIIDFNEFILNARDNLISEEEFIDKFQANFLVTDDQNILDDLSSFYNKLISKGMI